MTKGQWRNIRLGTEVFHETFHIDFETGRSVPNTLEGTIIRINSNHSQVLVKWDNSDFENWYGRLGIEIKNATF